MPVTKVKSGWSSGNLIFFEDGVGIGTTGDVLTIGTTSVIIGNTGQDVDFKVFFGSATEYVLFDCGNKRVDFGEDGKGVDLRLFGETASVSIIWDMSADTLILTGADIQLKDADILVFGTGAGVAGDIQISFTDGTGLAVVGSAAAEALLLGSDTYTLDTTLKGVLTVGKDATGHDVIFYSDTAGHKVWFDQNGDTNGAWYFGADTKGILTTWYGDTTGYLVKFDPSGDTNGAWYFGADDLGVDVIFYGQTASNSMTWDASANALVFVAGGITLGVATDIALDTATGTKIGTATNQKLGFWNTAPVIQQAHIADPAGGGTQDAEARTAINSINALCAILGLTAAA